jgi:hypothetical protein
MISGLWVVAHENGALESILTQSLQAKIDVAL